MNKKIIFGFLIIFLLSFTPYVVLAQDEDSQEVKMFVPSKTLELRIKSDKNYYEIQQDIWVDFIFKNVSEIPLNLAFYNAPYPVLCSFIVWDEGGEKIISFGPKNNMENKNMRRVEILPGNEYISKVRLNDWRLFKKGQGSNGIGEQYQKITVAGIYSTGMGILYLHPDNLFTGDLISNTIQIEIGDSCLRKVVFKEGDCQKNCMGVQFDVIQGECEEVRTVSCCEFSAPFQSIAECRKMCK